MPDGRSVLFTMVPEDSIEGAQIAVLDLKTLEARTVLKGGSAARYATTGHLVYASGQTLKAIAFDPETQQTRGDPVSLPDIEIATTPDNGAAEFAVSETGTLLFVTPNAPGQLLRTLSEASRVPGMQRHLGFIGTCGGTGVGAIVHLAGALRNGR
jgi:hypothetical protein